VGLTQIELAGSKAFGHDPELSVTSAVRAIFPPDERVRRAVVQVLGADVVFRDDGGTPTATQGQVIPAGDIYVYDGDRQAMLNFQVMAPTGTARLRVAYYGI
jgi:hypothetical protein